MYERQQRTAEWFTADNEMQSDWIVSENPLLEELWDKTLLQPLVPMNTNQKVRLLKLAVQLVVDLTLEAHWSKSKTSTYNFCL